MAITVEQSSALLALGIVVVLAAFIAVLNFAKPGAAPEPAPTETKRAVRGRKVAAAPKEEAAATPKPKKAPATPRGKSPAARPKSKSPAKARSKSVEPKAKKSPAKAPAGSKTPKAKSEKPKAETPRAQSRGRTRQPKTPAAQ